MARYNLIIPLVTALLLVFSEASDSKADPSGSETYSCDMDTVDFHDLYNHKDTKKHFENYLDCRASQPELYSFMKRSGAWLQKKNGRSEHWVYFFDHKILEERYNLRVCRIYHLKCMLKRLILPKHKNFLLLYDEDNVLEGFSIEGLRL